MRRGGSNRCLPPSSDHRSARMLAAQIPLRWNRSGEPLASPMGGHDQAVLDAKTHLGGVEQEATEDFSYQHKGKGSVDNGRKTTVVLRRGVSVQEETEDAGAHKCQGQAQREHNAVVLNH